MHAISRNNQAKLTGFLRSKSISTCIFQLISRLREKLGAHTYETLHDMCLGIDRRSFTPTDNQVKSEQKDSKMEMHRADSYHNLQ